MSRSDQKHLTELQMGCNADRNVLSIRTYADGTTYIAVSSPTGWSNFDTTLGQAIQLRDFLNRHIDELALQQTGSLAQRASDDPTQLAAVEEVPLQRHTDSGTGATWLEPGRVTQPGEGCGKPIIRGRVHQSMHCGETLEGVKRLCNECTARAARSV